MLVGLCLKEPGLSIYGRSEYTYGIIERINGVAGVYPALWNLHILYISIIIWFHRKRVIRELPLLPYLFYTLKCYGFDKVMQNVVGYAPFYKK